MEKTKKKKRKSNNAADAWKLFRKNKAAMAGLVVLAVFVFFALFADLLIPYEAAVIQSPKDRLMAPCMQHWLGTDEFGRDMLARIIHGSRRMQSWRHSRQITGRKVSFICGSCSGWIYPKALFPTGKRISSAN